MSPTLRRILIISGFILVVIAFVYLIYLVFFRPTPGGPLNTNQRNSNSQLPQAGNGNTNRVTGNINTLPIVNGTTPTGPSHTANGGPTIVDTVVPDPSSGLTANANDGGLQFYDETTGKFFRLSPDGSTKTLMTDAMYPNVDTIAWSPTGDKAILGFPDGSKVLYDFTLKKQTTLPKELNDFSWSPSSDQITSKYLDARDTDNQWLMVSKPDGSQSTSAEHLGANARKVIPDWSPNNQIIATYEKSTTGDQSQIIFLGPNGENYPSANIQGRGFIPNWTPDGRRVVFSAYSELTSNNPHLYMMNGAPDTLGTGLTDLGLDTTANKCTFSQDGFTMYCAVPYYLNPGSGPQPQLSAGVPDNIYSVDLLHGFSQVIARPVDSNQQQRFSISQMQLSTDETALYFVDAQTGTIQRIQLK